MHGVDIVASFRNLRLVPEDLFIKVQSELNSANAYAILKKTVCPPISFLHIHALFGFGETRQELKI